MILDAIPVKALFLDVVKRAKRRYDFCVENFCIMGNHYHLIIQPQHGANLSRIMQWIMSVFAMAYNKSCGLTGHVWGARFFSRIITNLREYLMVFTYIDENPVKACLTMEKGRWAFGGLDHHRRGCHDIVDLLPNWSALLFPAHGPQLLTERS
jgi:putative transposase